MIIPLRVVTAIIGIVLGYTAGTYIELLYEKRGDYRHEIAALLTGLKYGATWDTSSDCDEVIFFDSVPIDSSDEDTEESGDE